LGEGGEFHDFAAGEGGFVGAQADAGPVGGFHGVRVALAVLDEGADRARAVAGRTLARVYDRLGFLPAR
jgi:hypothetical protein